MFFSGFSLAYRCLPLLSLSAKTGISKINFFSFLVSFRILDF